MKSINSIKMSKKKPRENKQLKEKNKTVQDMNVEIEVIKNT